MLIDVFYIRRGYNIGVRLIEDFLARTNSNKCYDFRETADVIAKVCMCFYSIIMYGCMVVILLYVLVLCTVQYLLNGQ